MFLDLLSFFSLLLFSLALVLCFLNFPALLLFFFSCSLTARDSDIETQQTTVVQRQRQINIDSGKALRRPGEGLAAELLLKMVQYAEGVGAEAEIQTYAHLLLSSQRKELRIVETKVICVFLNLSSHLHIHLHPAKCTHSAKPSALHCSTPFFACFYQHFSDLGARSKGQHVLTMRN